VKIALLVVGILVVLILVMVIVGLFLPRNHVASGSAVTGHYGPANTRRASVPVPVNPPEKR